MFVGRIKKDLEQAIKEMVSEGIGRKVIDGMITEFLNHAAFTYNPETKTFMITYHKEF